MSFGFSSIGHAFASFFHDISVGAKAVEKVLVTKIAPLEPTIEAVTSIVYPPAVLIERAAFGLLGKVAAAAHDAAPAADAQGLNVTLDAQELADIRALVGSFRDELLALGLLKVALQPGTPAPTPAP